ncbi:MAG: hypothetical protein QXT63_07195 [Thermoplasmata archaeon]
MQKERRAQSLVKLDYDFYDDVNAYIQKMQEELYREIAKDPFSSNSILLNEQFKDICSMYKKIFEERMEKILKRAYVDLIGGTMDTKLLLKEEKIIYEGIMRILKESKEKILGRIEKNPQVKRYNQISTDGFILNADSKNESFNQSASSSDNLPNKHHETSPLSDEKEVKIADTTQISKDLKEDTAVISMQSLVDDEKTHTDEAENARKKAEIEEKEDEVIFTKSRDKSRSLENIDKEISIIILKEDLGSFVCPDDAKSYHLRAKDVATFSKTTAEILKRSGKVIEIKRELWS